MTHISFPTAAAILLSWWILWSRVNGRPYPNSWQICYVLGHILYLVCSTGPCTDKHSLCYKIRYLKYRLSMYRCSNTLNYMLPLVVSAGGHLFLNIYKSKIKRWRGQKKCLPLVMLHYGKRCSKERSWDGHLTLLQHYCLLRFLLCFN